MKQHGLPSLLKPAALAVMVATGTLTLGIAQAGAAGAKESLTASGVALTPTVAYDEATLTVVGPDGYRSSGTALTISAGELADGQYRYELRMSSGSEASGIDTTVHRGQFEVQGGTLVMPEEAQTQDENRQSAVETPQFIGVLAGAILDWLVPPAAALSVLIDDRVVSQHCASDLSPSGSGSGCLDDTGSVSQTWEDSPSGTGYTAYECRDSSGCAFHFEDSNGDDDDWWLSYNDGVDQFEIVRADDESGTNSTVPVAIEDGAPSGMLRLGSGGDVDLGTGGDVALSGADVFWDDSLQALGVNTSVPAGQGLHVVGDTGVALRIDDATASTTVWDLEASIASFYIRDVEGGNRVRFEIEEGTTPVFRQICLDGRTPGGGGGFGGVGFGTCNPGGDFTVTDIDGNNNTGFNLDLASTGRSWTFSQSSNGSMTVNLKGSGGQEATINARNNQDGKPTFVVQGDVQATTFVTSSSREAKKDFAPVSGEAVLAKLEEVPVMSWRYKKDRRQDMHYGVVAEDFQAAFGLGDGKSIATVDADGVAMAAIQGLHQKVKRQESELAAKDEAISRLAAELAELKKLVRSFTSVSLAQ